MKTRVIAAVILVPILLAIVLAAPKIVFAIVFGLLLALGVYELLYRTGLVVHIRLVIYSALMGFAAAIWSYFGAVESYALIGVLVFWILLFSEMMADHVKVSVEMLGLCFLGGCVVPYLLSALIRILNMTTGRFMILVPFVIAFLNDAGAYFVGLRFGKHKLAPVVSPHKTIEGVFGGVASAVVGMVLYALILDLAFSFRVNYGYAVLYGLLGSAAGVFGDLSYSVIKRQTGIKDYGYLIPGHGGFLDRFDSITIVAPLMEALILLMPMAV